MIDINPAGVKSSNGNNVKKEMAMDEKLVFAKTSLGDEAVRQRTRVVQRNLRMVLVQVDGNTSVGDLCAKIGNRAMVESALAELAAGGYVAPTAEAASAWEQSKLAAKNLKTGVTSQFSTFGTRSVAPASPNSQFSEGSLSSAFSSFGKPILPAPGSAEAPHSHWRQGPVATPSAPVAEEGRGERAWIRRHSLSTFLVTTVVGLILAGGLTLFAFPYDRYRGEVEAGLSALLKAPAKVGGVDFQAFPKPALVVSDVRVDGEGDLRIAQLRLPPPWAFIGSGARSIALAEVVDATIPADRLSALAGDSSGMPPSTVLRRARLSKVRVTAGDLALSDLNGEVSFNPSGQLEKLVVDTGDRTLHIEGVPSKLGIALAIQSFGWRPLDEKPYVFESMQVKGLLQKGKVLFQDVDTTFMGGVLKGSWLVDWNNGMVMAGEAALSHLNAERVAAAFYPKAKIEGDLSGAIRLRGAAESWRDMANKLQVSLDMDLVHGVVHGMDLGEAARRGGRPVLAGATRFDRLRGQLRLEPNGGVTVSNIVIDVGIMKASGALAMTPEEKVDGGFEVVVLGAMSAIRTPIRVFGTLPELQSVAGR